MPFWMQESASFIELIQISNYIYIFWNYPPSLRMSPAIPFSNTCVNLFCKHPSNVMRPMYLRLHCRSDFHDLWALGLSPS